MGNFKTKHLSVVALFVLSAVVAAGYGAEVFKWQDLQGKTHYSEYAQKGAQIVAIRPAYTYIAVQKVYDGDTVQLVDGRKVRLLGINTPEIAHRNRNAEIGGDAAKEWLEKRLRGKKVRLQTDVEKQDNYGRELAYLFTEEGAHINEELVKQGLAAVSIHPPNLLYVEPLLVAQREAETGKLGIWSYADYAVKSAAALSHEHSRGWQRLAGRINSVHRRGKYVYLDFSRQFSARISQDDLPLFADPDAYLGKEVEVRGWLSRSKEHYSLQLRHPSAIVVIH
jgi:micrococcal nuclease